MTGVQTCALPILNSFVELLLELIEEKIRRKGVLFATPVPAVIYGKIKRGMLGTLAIAVIFALSMYYLAVSANNPFLYFNF